MVTCQIVSHWAKVHEDLLALVDQFTDEELRFVSYEGAWSAGQVMLHIATAERGWFQHAVRHDLPTWPEAFPLEAYATTEAIIALLSEVHAETTHYLDTLDTADLTNWVALPWGESRPLLDVIWHVVEHEIHHRGELSLMLGQLGRSGLAV